MVSNKPDILLVGPSKPLMAKGLDPAFTVHKLIEATAIDITPDPVADEPEEDMSQY